MADSPAADYKLDLLISDRSYAAVHGPAVKTDALRKVALAFFDNMMRVDFLATLPAAIASVCLELGKGGNVGIYHNGNPTEQITSTNAWWFAADGHSPELFQARLKKSLAHVYGLEPMHGQSLQAWLSSLLLGTWTAFETLAGDLWVAVINAAPQPLARLGGTEKRIHQRAVAAHRDDAGGTNKQEKGMLVPITRMHDVTNGRYDLSRKMGEFLKSRVEFTRLWDIRRAYSLAFDETKLDPPLINSVDGSLADGSLDALAAVRNLIMHKAGVGDEDYTKKCMAATKAGLAIPVVDEGQSLRLDGGIVKSLIDPVVACCLKLFVAVDGWVDRAGSFPRYEAGAGI